MRDPSPLPYAVLIAKRRDTWKVSRRQLNMRIVVVGAGGTGGYFGGILARAGEDVTFIARGAQLEALRTRGLTVESKLAGTFTIAVQATDNPREVDPADLIVFCVKTYDTEVAVQSICPLIRPETMIMSLQNGIGNEELRRRGWSRKRPGQGRSSLESWAEELARAPKCWTTCCRGMESRWNSITLCRLSS